MTRLDAFVTRARMVRALRGVNLDSTQDRAWAYVLAGLTNEEIIAFDDEAVRVARLAPAMRRVKEAA